MGNLKIYRLIIIMSVVLSLLIVVQMSIIRNAAKIKDEQFGRVVKNSLGEVSRQLEEEERYRFLKVQGTVQQRTRQGGFSIMFNGGNGSFQASASFLPIDSIAQQQDIEQFFGGWSEFFKQEQDEIFNNGNFNEYITRSFQLIVSSRPIEQRIDKELLEFLIDYEFRYYGVDLNYEYAVKTYNQGVEKIVYSSDNYKNNKKGEHWIPLFGRDFGSQKPYYLKVYFPKRGMQFFMDTSFMVIPTILLVIMIIGIFAYTIMVIFKQKKLSIIKNDFINNMTHELKTPISTISLASQMLRDNSVANTPSAIDRISGVIYEESKRLSMQVEKVLQQAIFSEGRLKMKFRDIDLQEIISTTVQNFEIRAHAVNGKIDLNWQAGNAFIYGDHVHITNVFFNLLDNAVKYSKESPYIEVKAESNDKEIVVSVKDNGIGIAKEHHKQIFERFYRVPTGNVHDVKGFGLGLHYVFKIVEAHNGNIKVESALNKGTTFIVTFPLKNIDHGNKS